MKAMPDAKALKAMPPEKRRYWLDRIAKRNNRNLDKPQRVSFDAANKSRAGHYRTSLQHNLPTRLWGLIP